MRHITVDRGLFVIFIVAFLIIGLMLAALQGPRAHFQPVPATAIPTAIPYAPGQ